MDGKCAGLDREQEVEVTKMNEQETKEDKSDNEGQSHPPKATVDVSAAKPIPTFT
jgi:hypothetical protein